MGVLVCCESYRGWSDSCTRDELFRVAEVYLFYGIVVAMSLQKAELQEMIVDSLVGKGVLTLPTNGDKVPVVGAEVAPGASHVDPGEGPLERGGEAVLLPVLNRTSGRPSVLALVSGVL